MTIEFDTWLEVGLEVEFVSFAKDPIPAGAPYRSRRAASAPPWSVARVATRTVVVLAAAASGLMATGALAAAAVTGSADPQVWTQHITMAIGTCAAQGAGGQGGIASCVSAIVHYQGPRSQYHRTPAEIRAGASLPAPTPEVKPGGPTNGNGLKKGGSGVTPAASDTNVPHGRPTDLPAGPPAGMAHGRPSHVPAATHTPRGNPPATPPAKGH
jgi:hypothetical protein